MIAKQIKKKNVTITLNFSYVKREKIYPAYLLKQLKSPKTSYSYNNFKWRKKGS